jgi:hypothetical protein
MESMTDWAFSWPISVIWGFVSVYLTREQGTRECAKG